jgi:hypothetical protein
MKNKCTKDESTFLRWSHIILRRYKILVSSEDEGYEKVCSSNNQIITCMTVPELYSILIFYHFKDITQSNEIENYLFKNCFFTPKNCLRKRTPKNVRTDITICSFGIHPKSFTISPPPEDSYIYDGKKGIHFCVGNKDAELNCAGVFTEKKLFSEHVIPNVRPDEIEKNEKFFETIYKISRELFENERFPLFVTVSCLYINNFNEWVLSILYCFANNLIRKEYGEDDDSEKIVRKTSELLISICKPINDSNITKVSNWIYDDKAKKSEIRDTLKGVFEKSEEGRKKLDILLNLVTNYHEAMINPNGEYNRTNVTDEIKNLFKEGGLYPHVVPLMENYIRF